MKNKIAAVLSLIAILSLPLHARAGTLEGPRTPLQLLATSIRLVGAPTLGQLGNPALTTLAGLDFSQAENARKLFPMTGHQVATKDFMELDRLLSMPEPDRAAIARFLLKATQETTEAARVAVDILVRQYREGNIPPELLDFSKEEVADHWLDTPFEPPTNGELAKIRDELGLRIEARDEATKAKAEAWADRLRPTPSVIEDQGVEGQSVENGYGRLPLSEPARLSLLKAAAKTKDYKVSLFKDVRSPERDRLVVVLGEVHVKGESASALGREVIEHFDHQGLESNDPTLTLGGRLLQMLHLDSLGGKFREWVGKFSGRSKSSSIDDAAGRITAQNFKENVIRIINAPDSKERQALWDLVKDKPAEELDGMISINGYETISLREIRDLFDRKGGAPKARASAAQKKIHWLEEGHRPDWTEQLESLDWVVTSVLGALFGVVLAFAKEMSPAVWALVAVSTIYFAQWHLGEFLRKRYEHARWFPYVFPVTIGLLRARNKTMAANIRKALDEDPRIESMLNIVGMAHNPGIAKELVEKHGFVEVPLEALKPK
ncbi:MAG: hypothetical protein HY077_08175 [Elusimicrobia bacterium]|nr:hypothetical protein [Elusimicrobiota bacterium]